MLQRTKLVLLPTGSAKFPHTLDRWNEDHLTSTMASDSIMHKVYMTVLPELTAANMDHTANCALACVTLNPKSPIIN